MNIAPKALLAAFAFVPFLAASPLSGNDGLPRAVVISDDDGDTVEVQGSTTMVRPRVRFHFEGGSRLGISLVDITPDLRAHFGAPRDAGVLVGGVEKDSPASRAGLEVGDVVTSVDGEKVETPGELARAIRRKPAGETVSIEVVRNRSTRKLTAKVEERPTEDAWLGPDFERDLSREIRRGMRNVRPFVYDFDSDGRTLRALPPRDLKQLEEKLRDLDRRLKELEGRSR